MKHSDFRRYIKLLLMLFSESFLVADIIEREASLNKMKSSIELLFYWCGRGLNMYCLYTLYVCINSVFKGIQ